MIAHIEKYFKGIASVLLALTFIVSCTSDKKKEGSASEEFEEAAESVKEQIDKVLYEIPPPSEIPYIIQSTGADFNPNIPNSIDNYESYTISQHKAAFNLGVYATDIGYLSSYGKTQEALNYMDVSMKLSESIGIQDAIDLEVLSRFEQNLSNTDSLAIIIDESIKNSDDYLQMNERENVAALVIGGTFVEGLYITTQIIDTYPKDILADDQRMTILAPLISTLAKQKEPLGDMIALLKSVDNKGDWIEATISSLEDLHESYETFNPEEKIENDQGHEVLNDEVLHNLTEQIASIRDNIIY